MSFFWGSWITVFSLGCWAFILVVLVWTVRHRPVLEKDETTGHSYDGIREYDKPLPKWWLWVFYGTMAWAPVYLILYPSIQPNVLKGMATVSVDGQELNWTSQNELNSELQTNNEKFLGNFDAMLANAGATDAKPVLAKLSELQKQRDTNPTPPADLQTQIDDQIKALAPFVDKLSADPEAQKIGNRLFLQNCALCHGSNAHGGRGYPNLTDNDWLYGGQAENILTTLHKGRVGGMAAWQKQIGESGVRAAAEYVMSVSGNINNDTLDNTLVTQGEVLFKQNCVLCHGQDAKGNHDMGAPNLTDDIWLYGSERETIRETVRHGRAGVMPAWEKRLGNERVMLLASYVRFISQNNPQ